MATNLYGNPPSNWTAAYGGSPLVPNPTTTARDAISGNIGNLGSLYGMAGNINQFQNAQALLNLTNNLPGYQGMVDQSSRNILQNLQGQVSGDVINEILQGAAERGISTGQGPAGPNSNAAYLRALGLTSLGLQQTGEKQLTEAIGRTPTVAPMDISKFLVTPDEQQQAQAAANLYASAPNPAAAAAARNAAAMAGLNAGRSSVGGSPSRGADWWKPASERGSGGPGMVVGNSTGTGYYSNGQYITGNESGNWNDWYNSLNRSNWGTSPLTEDDVWGYLGVDLGGVNTAPPSEADAWADLGVDLYGPNTNEAPFLDAGGFMDNDWSFDSGLFG